MIYVGIHSAYNVNDKYMGSGPNIIKAIKEEGRDNFTKEILFEFDNEIDMIKKEIEIVNEEFITRPDTYNIALGGGIFNMLNCIVVKDKDGNTMAVNKKDPRYLSGELVFICSNKVTVKDRDGNMFQVDIDDPRYLSG